MKARISSYSVYLEPGDSKVYNAMFWQFGGFSGPEGHSDLRYWPGGLQPQRKGGQSIKIIDISIFNLGFQIYALFFKKWMLRFNSCIFIFRVHCKSAKAKINTQSYAPIGSNNP